MEDRRKIIIPIGAKPETPQFDAEETLASARPVVPLAAPGRGQGELKAARGRVPVYRRISFLALITITAIIIGMAAGLNLARYRYQQRNATAVAAQPAQAPANGEPHAVTVQNSQPDKQAQAAQLPEVKTEEKTPDDKAKTDETAKANTPEKAKTSETPETSSDKGTGDKQTEDTAKTSRPGARDKKRTDDEAENDNAPRTQKRDRRQKNSNDSNNPLDVPNQIERASEQINRIREIFEGRPQRP